MPNQTLTFLKHRFEEVGLRLNTRHGQNFLIDLNLQNILVESAQLSRDDLVLEVGTGTGALSALIAPQVAHLVTVEVDPRLAQLASEELIDHRNVTLLQQDALAGKHTIAPEVLSALNRHFDQSPQRRFKLVANLPYNIATPLVANLLTLDRPPELMVVTIQKELADRLMAQPCTKDYGAFSLWVQCQCQVELLRVMPPEVFWPRPKVHSAIVRITLQSERRGAIADLEFFRQFVHWLFLHRRKLLRVVLAGQFKSQLDKPAVDDLLRQLNLGEKARAEELPVEQMVRLADAVQKRIGSSAAAD